MYNMQVVHTYKLEVIQINHIIQCDNIYANRVTDTFKYFKYFISIVNMIIYFCYLKFFY